MPAALSRRGVAAGRTAHATERPTPMQTLIREFRRGDEPALRAVFESAIHEVAIRDYTQAQVDAWAPRDFDATLWAKRVQGIAPFVVERDGEIVAYADVQASGYIDHFFVGARAGKQGVGGMLMRRIHERAHELDIAVLTSEVSRTAQPFYVHFGFEIVERHVKEVRGVGIEYAAMRKVLRGQGAQETGFRGPSRGVAEGS